MGKSIRFEAAGFLAGFLKARIISVFQAILSSARLAIDGQYHQILAGAKTCITASFR
jgi:hypothetical protein